MTLDNRSQLKGGETLQCSNIVTTGFAPSRAHNNGPRHAQDSVGGRLHSASQQLRRQDAARQDADHFNPPEAGPRPRRTADARSCTACVRTCFRALSCNAPTRPAPTPPCAQRQHPDAAGTPRPQWRAPGGPAGGGRARAACCQRRRPYAWCPSHPACAPPACRSDLRRPPAVVDVAGRGGPKRKATTGWCASEDVACYAQEQTKARRISGGGFAQHAHLLEELHRARVVQCVLADVGDLCTLLQRSR